MISPQRAGAATSSCGSSRWRPGSATRRSACSTSACCARSSSKMWVERCEAQIAGVLDVLEKERAAVKTPYWFGERIGHSDIAVACVLRFTGEAHPALLSGGALSGADRARRALRGAAAVPGNRAAAGAAERGLRSSLRHPLILRSREAASRRMAAHSSSSFRGARSASPESNHDRELWIPGLRLAAHPGMTIERSRVTIATRRANQFRLSEIVSSP